MPTKEPSSFRAGSVSAEMRFSATGVMARKLRLKEGDPVKVTVQRF